MGSIEPLERTVAVADPRVDLCDLEREGLAVARDRGVERSARFLRVSQVVLDHRGGEEAAGGHAVRIEDLARLRRLPREQPGSRQVVARRMRIGRELERALERIAREVELPVVFRIFPSEFQTVYESGSISAALD